MSKLPKLQPNNQNFKVLGFEFTQENFPLLYQQAKANPQMLETTIKSMIAKQYDNDMKAVPSAMLMLELDLEHEQLVKQ